MGRARSVDGRHWPELDGLRALAILLVLARHSLRPFISEDDYAAVATWGPVDVTPLLLNGWIGVDLFFVLSGFLIGRQALGCDSWSRFWFKRITRIVPAYWTCLVVVALVVTLSGTWPQSAGDFVAHVFMLQDYTGTAFVPAFWSLGAEEKFYLLAPLLALGVTRLGSRAGQAAALSALWMAPMAVRAAMAWGASFPVSYEAYFPVFRSPFHVTSESLVLGFSVAWASRHLELVRLSRAWREGLFWTGSVALGAATTTVVLLGDIGPLTVVGVPAAVGLAFAALVVAAIAGRGSYTAALAWRGWRPLATGAFTLYLTHMMVIPVASAVALDAVARGGPLLQQWMRFVPWYLALSVASAWLLHIGVERPVLRWRDRWLSGRDGVGAREDGTIDSSPDDSGRLAVRA